MQKKLNGLDELVSIIVDMEYCMSLERTKHQSRMKTRIQSMEGKLV